MRLSGHPKYCPESVAVEVCSSMCGTSTLVPGFIGPGPCLIFRHPGGRVIRTSRVREVRTLNSALMICSETCTDERKDSERGGRA